MGLFNILFGEYKGKEIAEGKKKIQDMHYAHLKKVLKLKTHEERVEMLLLTVVEKLHCISMQVIDK